VLAKLEKLQLLNLQMNYKVKDLSSLKNLKNLRSIDIKNTAVRDFTFVQNFPDLEELYLLMPDQDFLAATETMPSLAPLGQLKQMKVLSITWIRTMCRCRVIIPS
jgi:hypothetical protein